MVTYCHALYEGAFIIYSINYHAGILRGWQNMFTDLSRNIYQNFNKLAVVLLPADTLYSLNLYM